MESRLEARGSRLEAVRRQSKMAEEEEEEEEEEDGAEENPKTPGAALRPTCHRRAVARIQEPAKLTLPDTSASRTIRIQTTDVGANIE